MIVTSKIIWRGTPIIYDFSCATLSSPHCSIASTSQCYLCIVITSIHFLFTLIERQKKKNKRPHPSPNKQSLASFCILFILIFHKGSSIPTFFFFSRRSLLVILHKAFSKTIVHSRARQLSGTLIHTCVPSLSSLLSRSPGQLMFFFTIFSLSIMINLPFIYLLYFFHCHTY